MSMILQVEMCTWICGENLMELGRVRLHCEGHPFGTPENGNSSDVPIEIYVAAKWLSLTRAPHCAGSSG